MDRYENATVTLVNTLTTADLSISKTVSGNMGNKTRSFAFTVTIPEMANRTVTPRDKDGDALDEETFDEKGVITVHLKHGETIAIPGVPVGASYTVKEDNGLYTATYQVSGGAKQNGAEVTGTMPATGLEVAYNNELNVAVSLYRSGAVGNSACRSNSAAAQTTKEGDARLTQHGQH